MATANFMPSVVSERPLPKDLEQKMYNPGYPREKYVEDSEHALPEAFESKNPARQSMTPLQKHIEFFDRDKDGVITMPETYQGFRAVGFGVLYSLAAVMFIHFNMAYPTQDGWISNPLFHIHIRNIHRAKHGSDTESYDTEGRFVPEKFEEIFSKYDVNNIGGLDFWQGYSMTEAMRNLVDPVGWVAAKVEWATIYFLAADENGVVSKETLLLYDGSLFYHLEEKYKNMKNE